MTRIKVDGYDVDVVDDDCAFRDCFVLGFDKGTFSQGHGYTSYYKPRPVCWRRHLDGCPHKEPEEGVDELRDDGSVLLALRDPLPCCAVPDVPNNPRAYRQTCRSCGARLTGARLEMARGTWVDRSVKVRREGNRWVAA
jgi:hypothetical protein